ncbi:MAG: DUF2911 domain-containing protein [Terrimonas sp.]|nr:DUF2911 domain-containing protein [Terrimonas sp.]
MLKKILTSCIALLTLWSVDAQQLTTPAPSPTTSVKQDFGLSSIELSYSRPGMKGRKIFGDLVPYGQVWRTGANGATTLTFGDEVTIGDKKIAPGKYGLLTIPGENEWTIIITKQTDVTSPAAYKKDQDIVRVMLKPQMLPFSVETFTIGVNDIKSTSCTIGIMWDNVYVGLPVSTNIDDKVMAQIKTAMSSENPPYFNAAMYYMENGKDINQALEWFTKAEKQSPDAFWVVYQKAKCLAKLGKKSEAIESAMKSKDMAAKASNGDYVKLNEDLIKSLK